MWVGRIDGNAVYFSDVRSLVRQLGVRGNVSVTNSVMGHTSLPK